MKTLVKFLYLFFFILIWNSGFTKTYNTVHTETLPVIDGLLTDEVWTKVNWGDEFVQHEPYSGKPATQQTAFKVIYNTDHIYVGIRAFDSSPDSIVRRIARRDALDGDFVGIQFDSYHDLRTAFIFAVNSSGVIWDGMCINDGDIWDDTWDPIWNVKTHIDDKGWTAEMEIPLSQLRFGSNAEQKWGLQVVRNLYRAGELSTWQFIPQDAPGWVHLFGTLDGIKNIKPKRQVEILPYLVGQHKNYEKEADNPFLPGKENHLAGGIDGKIGLTNDLTLNFTVNPDFGQVEADPSEVNLTAFESYFSEKRPFFIEGNNILSFQITQGDGGFASDNLFYSRRIGRTPHYYPDLADGEYTKVPDNTNILSAAKVTGKTKDGLSVGILESVTALERAEIDLEGKRRHEVVEPMTNYFVTRLQKDVNDGNTIFGGMITSTHRYINNDQLNFLHKDAITGGFDFLHQWKDKTYYFSMNALFSSVRGSTDALIETQSSSRRYFQRPDADYIKIDSGLTSLSGHGGTLNFGKGGNGHIRYTTWVTWRSPGLELNDIGFLRSADWIMEVFWLQYRLYEPFSIFRNFTVNINQWSGFDFGGTNIFNGGNVNTNMQFANYWRFGTGINLSGKSISNSDLRGGPALVNEGGINNWFNISTDDRKKVSFSIGGSNFWGKNDESRRINFWAGTNLKPGKAFSISFDPMFSKRFSFNQYVETIDIDASHTKYLMASIHQKTLSFSLRFNYSLTPKISLQYYAQPFISEGKYYDFKWINNPHSDDINQRFSIINTKMISYSEESEEYSITEGNSEYTISTPDYKFLQYRSNLVARWEFSPGSTLFLVWSQDKTEYDSDAQQFSLTENTKDLWNVYPGNIFLIKISFMISS